MGNSKRDVFYKARIMAGVNIFISSTCYDLSQVRQDLREFISGLGHTPMMPEQNNLQPRKKRDSYPCTIISIPQTFNDYV